MIKVISARPRIRQAISPREPRTSKFKKADVVRAVDAARAAGLLVAEIEVRTDGSAIRISSPDARPRTDGDLFTRWEQRL